MRTKEENATRMRIVRANAREELAAGKLKLKHRHIIATLKNRGQFVRLKER